MVEGLIKELRMAEEEALKIEEEGKQKIKEIFSNIEKELNQLKEIKRQELESLTNQIEQEIKEELENYSYELKEKGKQLDEELNKKKLLKKEKVFTYLNDLIFTLVQHGNS